MPSESICGFPKYPSFRINSPRFPQDTFLGRYLHYLDVIDPTTLFVSDKRLRECVQLLENWQKGDRTASDKELWRAQKIKQAILHPDTGEKVLPPFRMSGFVPFGWITVTGMLLPNPSWPTLLFWQWMNQSHNACVNYANRNATQQQPFSTYVGAYGAAVTAACSISAGLTYLIKRSKSMPLARQIIVQRFVPLPAVSLASSVNVICMRWNELKTGIDVYENGGKVIGASKVAAKQAVTDTTLVRAFLPIPLLLAPPCIMPFLERLKWVSGSPIRHLFVNAVVCTLSFAASLPIALALFPQEGNIVTDKLEPEIQSKTRADRLFYNKGL
ncbi:Sideroflexin-5 [Parelaphostrongylus tenuis]|uniref:Sidoreflexin n=1 Tax=Parelaphostrongylus tenuis TaxID=148309 RepID=A0AAD5WG85_PARTN|nr:Sideroflexin-5 [Parelaphostrongylus tenuis]